MRRHDLDNIRWATILLVVVYHVIYLFNAAGVLGGLEPFAPVQYQDGLLYLVYPWFMVLLFVVSGICARYALEKEPVKEFLKRRTVKLLVPATLGLFAFQWILGWVNVTISGSMDLLPPIAPIRYLIFVLSGVGPLWFSQTLWLYCLLLALLRKLDSRDRLYTLCGRLPGWSLPLMFLPLWGGAQVLNMPVITVYRFGIYLVAFLLGYLVLSQEKHQVSLEKIRLYTLACALCLGAAYVITYFGTDYTSDGCLKSLFTNVYAWAAVLAVLGCGRAWFHFETPLTAYLSRSSYGVYVLHYLFTALSCWLLRTYTQLPAAAVYLIAIFAGVAGSLVCWEVLRRIPGIRFLVLGIQKRKDSSVCS